MRDPVHIAWNDHVAAFESIAVLVGEHVGNGMEPKEAFVLVWDQVAVPAEFRDKYWRVAVPVLAEHGLRTGTAPDLRGLDLAGIDLEEGDLRGFDLRDADLTGAFLGDALLDGADLTGADLTDADLTGTSLTGTTMPDGSVHD
ncbi:MAG: pentapeptide repeat-containing protein [Gaiellales bacterium]